MRKQFQNNIKHRLRLNSKAKILIAVSGGRDSMALLMLASSYFKDIIALHCNFNLRGFESSQDQKLVEEFCSSNNIQLKVISFDTKLEMEIRKTSLQETARNLRYDWFNSVLKEENFDFISTAHHLDDHLETFMINFSRGSGIKGLTGIPEKTSTLIRPLLRFTRQEITDYCKQEKIPYTDDSSNQKADYLRNHLRINVIPQWKKEESQFLNKIQTSLDYLKDHQSLLEDLVEDFKRDNYLDHKVSKEALNAGKPLVVSEFLKSQGLNKSDQEDLFQSVDNKRVGSTIVGNGVIALVDRTHVIFKKTVERKGEEEEEVLVAEDTFKIQSPISITFSKVKDWTISKDSNIEGFDFDRLKFPLIIRKWKKGDYFYPIGMKGKKKVSEFLIDKKLTLFEKEEVYVLESNKEIVWLIGYRGDDRFKIAKDSRNVYLAKRLN